MSQSNYSESLLSNQTLKSNPLISLVDEIVRLQGRVKNLFAEVHWGTGLRVMEDVVLQAIAEADFTPTVPQIGRSLGHPRQVIQRAVNDLACAGFIERLPNPDHKRAPLLAVTAKGRALKESSDAQALAVADAFLERVDAGYCEALAHELKGLRRELEAFSREQPMSVESKKGE